MIQDRGIGIVTIAGSHSVDETVQKLQGILEAKGIRLFALIDHSGEAEKVGLQMRARRASMTGRGVPLG
jgi:uncharacterized protein (DUF302 family)